MARWMFLLPFIAVAVQIREEVPTLGHDYAGLKAMMMQFAAKTKETGKIDQATVDAVTRFLTDINGTLLTALDNDRAHSQRIYDDALAAVNRCNSERISWFGMNGTYGSWNTDVTNRKEDHANCRTQELVTFQNMSSKCQTFENRVCNWDVCELPAGGFASGDSDAVFSYMTCLDALFTAQRGGYGTDKANCETATALHEAQIEFCDTKQNSFEVGYCLRETHVQDECESYDTCRFNEETDYLQVLGETHEVEDIFQAQFVALHHLLCYGDKILQNSTDLASCDAVGDNCTGDYVNCPRIVYSEPQDFILCSEPAAGYPCTTQFKGFFYNTWMTPESRTPIDDCTPCLDAEVVSNQWGGGRKTIPGTTPTLAPTDVQVPDPVPTEAPVAVAGATPYCIKVRTGNGVDDNGDLVVEVDAGNGMVEEASGEYGKCAVVLEKCFSEFQGVQVSNPTDNAWGGSIEFSRDSGATYAPMVCSDCTSAGRTDLISVDGNTDGASMAWTHCLSGSTCSLSEYQVESLSELQCLRVITGHEDYADGYLSLEVDSGSGLVEVASGFHALNSVVLQQCYGEVRNMRVKNTETNAWRGAIEFSTDGGATYGTPECTGCSAMGTTLRIVVDGNGDGATMADTQCLNGGTCEINMHNISPLPSCSD